MGHRRDFAAWLLAGVCAVAACASQRDGDQPKSDQPETEQVVRADPDPPPPSPRSSVYDFIDNRARAHRWIGGGLWSDGASAGFAKYVRFHRGRQWKNLSGGANATVTAKRAWLLVGPLPELDRARVIVRVRANKPQTVSLHRGRKRLVSARVDGDGALRAELELEGDRELALELRTRGRDLQVASIWVGPADAASPESATALAADAVVLGKGEALVHHLYVPEGARLEADTDGACRPWAVVEGSTGGASAPIAAGGLELEEVEGRFARVRIENRDCEALTIQRLQLTVLEVPTPPQKSGATPRYVLFWVMDTLRADRVKVVNPEARAEVPSFERLARRGVVFRHTYVGGNESQTSHACLWTGTFPARHGIRSAGDGGRWDISKKLPTLGQELRSAGLEPVGVTGNGMVVSGAGYGRGFSKFINMMREHNPDRRNGYIPARKIVARAMKLFEPIRERPAALFIGTIDTHKPYIGHQPWLDRYDPGPYRGPFKRAALPRDLGIVRGSMKCAPEVSKRDLQRILAIYDSDISYQDQELGKVLDRLEEWGIADQTLIVVTADHGEEMWEDGRCGHGITSRESLVHVPLLISYPPRLPGGVVIDEGVDGADVLPTILELLDRPIPATVQGRSLVEIAHRTRWVYPRPSYASQYEYAHVMRVGRFKLRAGPRGSLRFYDLHERPREMRDQGADFPVERGFLIDSLQLFLVHRWHWKKAEWGDPSNLSPAGAGFLAGVDQD